MPTILGKKAAISRFLSREQKNQRLVSDLRVVDVLSSDALVMLGARRLEAELCQPMYPRRIAITAAAVAPGGTLSGGLVTTAGAESSVDRLLGLAHAKLSLKVRSVNADVKFR